MMASATLIDPYFEFRAGQTNRAETSGSLRDGMHLEVMRLGSFKNWPRWAPVSPNRLAKAGFFYTGELDETECFQCSCKISKWHDGDRPADRHLRVSRDCLFVKGRETSNIPLPRPGDLLDRPMNNSGTVGRAQASARGLVSDSIYESSSNEIPRSILSPSYQQVAARLETFRNFPTSCYVSADELAQAGFIYLGHSDRVQCAFCKGVLKNWAPGDRAFSEHQKHFPHCAFVQNPSAAHSVAVPSSPSAASASVTAPRTQTQQLNSQVLSGPLHELGIETDRPKHHAFAVEAHRLATFNKDWPQNVRQQPSDLAKAGFFYIGQADSVKCFWCDGGLRNWDSNDDPWVEHARWFPKCGYVKRSKGSAFIESCKRANQESSSVSAPPPERAVPRDIDPRDISARLDTAGVKGILEMGFERQFVKNVIEYRLRTSGDDFGSAEDMLEMCLEFSHSPPSNFPLPPMEAPATPAAEPTPAPQPAPSASHRAKPAAAGGNSVECKICMDEDVNVVFLPCGHLVCCSNCAPALKKCPICRGLIRGTVNAILS